MKNKHKKINFFDPQINVKKKLVNEKFQYLPGTKIPLPSEVEISESGTCNRKCSFCPRSDPNYLDIKEFIKTALHDKLHKELAELKFSGTVRYSGFSWNLTAIYYLIPIGMVPLFYYALIKKFKYENLY